MTDLDTNRWLKNANLLEEEIDQREDQGHHHDYVKKAIELARKNKFVTPKEAAKSSMKDLSTKQVEERKAEYARARSLIRSSRLFYPERGTPDDDHSWNTKYYLRSSDPYEVHDKEIFDAQTAPVDDDSNHTIKERWQKLAGILKEGTDPVSDDENKKQMMFSVLSDVYKEVHGVRPRHLSYDELSLGEIISKLNDLYEQEDYIDDLDYDYDDEQDANAVRHQDDIEAQDKLNAEYDELGPDDDYDLMPSQAGIARPIKERSFPGPVGMNRGIDPRPQGDIGVVGKSQAATLPHSNKNPKDDNNVVAMFDKEEVKKIAIKLAKEQPDGVVTPLAIYKTVSPAAAGGRNYKAEGPIVDFLYNDPDFIEVKDPKKPPSSSKTYRYQPQQTNESSMRTRHGRRSLKEEFWEPDPYEPHEEPSTGCKDKYLVHAIALAKKFDGVITPAQVAYAVHKGDPKFRRYIYDAEDSINDSEMFSVLRDADKSFDRVFTKYYFIGPEDACESEISSTIVKETVEWFIINKGKKIR